MKAIAKIQRLDPGDRKPYYSKYEVEVEKGMNIADVLKQVLVKDSSLAFKKGCGSGICGTCAMQVNGMARLACRTQAMQLVEDHGGVIVIEPLKNMTVIKDLVVDMDRFFEQIKDAISWLDNPNGREWEGDRVDFEKSEECIYCGACVADCGVVGNEDNFLGPAAFVKGFRFIKDPRSTNVLGRIRLYNKLGLWNCAHAFNCIDVCPKGIDPAEKIAKLREMSIENGIGGRGARHAKHFVSSLERSGKLDEVGMTLKTLMPWGMPAFVGDAARMLAKGRIPAMFPKKIEELSQVKALTAIAKERKSESTEEDAD